MVAGGSNTSCPRGTVDSVDLCLRMDRSSAKWEVAVRGDAAQQRWIRATASWGAAGKRPGALRASYRDHVEVVAEWIVGTAPVGDRSRTLSVFHTQPTRYVAGG